VAVRVKIFFITEMQSSGQDEERQSFTVSQLMAAGAMLVALESGDEGLQGESGGAKAEIELIPGDNVELSADKRPCWQRRPVIRKW
jgi:hypothetical protein